jgi:ribosomal protein S18 acetylase RimI-like enzyme
MELFNVVEDYILRPMKPEDWKEFHYLEKKSFEEKDWQTEDQFERGMQNGIFLALEVNDQIIGQLRLTRFGEDEAHLNRIAVAREHQRKGWGKVLLQYAIDWFKNEKDITTVHLYTQDYNLAAQSLYEMYGFEKIAITWNYFVPFASLKPKGDYTCQVIQGNEIDYVGKEYPNLPAARIREILEDEEKRDFVLTLKNDKGAIVGAARFSPWFPGSFPFEITSIDCFDDFMKGMEKLRLPEFDYVRIVFSDNEELAKLCEERNYHLHHKLVKMSLQL